MSIQPASYHFKLIVLSGEISRIDFMVFTFGRAWSIIEAKRKMASSMKTMFVPLVAWDDPAVDR